MARLINIDNKQEGLIWCKWLENRFLSNKNVLGAETGGTGSGKSYRDLRKAELWYKYKFDEPFPRENICFSVARVMNRLQSKKLRKGELLIFEEAGANLGSLDFQTQISKMFTYVLQSFRSMNIGILFNLPYLSMLNKQARMLLHYRFESVSIDFKTNMNKCKPFFLQTNQKSGKTYEKYFRVKVKGKVVPVKRMSFGMPSPELVKAYEEEKQMFLTELTDEFRRKLKKYDEDQLLKERRGMPSELLIKTNKRLDTELPEEIAEKDGISVRSVNYRLKKLQEYGLEPSKKVKSLRKSRKRNL